MKYIISTMLFMITILMLSAQTTRYVRPTASGTANGSSWANASDDLQLMINNSSSGDQIWVAAGTYRPNRRADATGTITLNNRDNAFVLKSGVSIYGGFAGTETAFSQRNLANTANASILSGDYGTADNYVSFTNMTTNAYHVVIAAGPLPNTIFDGFTIQGAYYLNGTDLNATLTINSRTLDRQYGGALCIVESSPTISNVTFANNLNYLGSGLYTQGTSSTVGSITPTIVNCTFTNNRATFGAGILNFWTTPSFFNCLIYGNRTTNEGAGAYNWNSTVAYTNVTVTKNIATSANGGGMYHLNGTVNTRNSIVFGNLGTGTGFQPQVNFSGTTVNLFNNIFQGWAGGSNGNLNATGVSINDIFIDTTNNNDFRLKPNAIAVNAGNNTYISGYTTDFDGRARIATTTVDLGAYEYAKFLKKWDRGASTDNWIDHANWIPDGAPVSSDSVVLDNQYVSGNYTVNMPNTRVSVGSLRIYPSVSTSNIVLEIPTVTPAVGQLRLTGRGFHTLAVGERGRINNRHGGNALFRSVTIADSVNYGMLLDTGAYYLHNTLTRDLPFLYNLNARLNSTWEYQRNINGTDNNFMIFPAPTTQYPGLSQIKFYNLILSGFSPVFSPDYAVTPARNWDMYIDGDLTVRNNAAFGFHRGGSGQDNRSIYLKGNINITSTTNTSWIGTLAPVTLAWRFFFNGTTQQQINGNVDFLDRVEINNPNGLVINNTLNISTNSFSFYTSTLPSIVFNQGILTTTSGTGLISINVTTSGAIVNHSPTGYINGRLRRNVAVNTAYDFPIGNSTSYQLATLTFGANLGGVVNITTEFITTPLTPFNTLTESPNTFNGIVNAGFWRITSNANISAAGTYTLRLNQRGFTTPNQQPCASTIGRRPNTSTPWSLLGTAQTVSPLTPGVASAQRQYASSASSIGTASTDFAIIHTSSLGQTYYQDVDGDGWYTNTVSSCSSVGAGWSTTFTGGAGDCAPNDNTKWQSNSIYIDADGDGYDNGTATICYGNTAPIGYSLTTFGTDCNDNNASFGANCSLVWTANATNIIDKTNWFNPINWNPNVIPNENIDVTIPNNPAGGNYFPILSGNVTGIAKNVSIQSGASVTLNITATLEVNGDFNYSGTIRLALGEGTLEMKGNNISGKISVDELLINQSGIINVTANSEIDVNEVLTLDLGTLNINSTAKVTLKSTATSTGYVDDFDALGNTNANTGITGNITIERFIPANGFDAFHYIGIANGTAGATANSIWHTGAGSFPSGANVGVDRTPVIPTSTCDPNALEIGSPYGNVFSYDESNITFCSQQGWEVRTASAGVSRGAGFAAIIASLPLTIDEEGSYANSDVTLNNLSITASSPIDIAVRGNHLVGNPFFAPIHWNTLAAKPANNNVDGTAFVYDPVDGQYEEYSLLSNQNVPIPTSQAFFIRSKPSVTGTFSFTFDKTARIADDNSVFYRNNQPYSYALNIDITATANNATDEAMIAFGNDFTDAYDSGFDAVKFPGVAVVPTLYMKDVAADKYAIMALAENTQTRSIPLSLKAGASGNHTFTFDGVNDFPATAIIWLEDLQTGTIQFLRQNNSYSFTANTSDNPDRFILHFAPEMLITSTPADCNNENGSISIAERGGLNWSYELQNSNSQNVAQNANFSGTDNISSLPGNTYTLNLSHPLSGYSTSQSITITQLPAVVAQINSSATTLAVNEVISIDAANSTGANTYNWQMGDGTTYNNQSQVSHSYSQAGNYTITLNANNDDCADDATLLVMVEDMATSIANSKEEAGIKVYANGNSLYITQMLSKENLKATLTLYNTLGQVVISTTSIEASYNTPSTISLTEVASGTYMAHIKAGNKTTMKKIVVSR